MLKRDTAIETAVSGTVKKKHELHHELSDIWEAAYTSAIVYVQCSVAFVTVARSFVRSFVRSLCVRWTSELYACLASQVAIKP